jgi:hypothetical protein
MIYGWGNTDRHTSVYDVDTMEQLRNVSTINTKTGEVVVLAWPLTLNEEGEPVTQSMRYTTIYPIFGGGLQPCLFHCYGRIE